jgi:hypothetical protein
MSRLVQFSLQPEPAPGPYGSLDQSSISIMTERATIPISGISIGSSVTRTRAMQRPNAVGVTQRRLT